MVFYITFLVSIPISIFYIRNCFTVSYSDLCFCITQVFMFFYLSVCDMASKPAIHFLLLYIFISPSSVSILLWEIYSVTIMASFSDLLLLQYFLCSFSYSNIHISSWIFRCSSWYQNFIPYFLLIFLLYINCILTLVACFIGWNFPIPLVLLPLSVFTASQAGDLVTALA